MLRVDVAGFRRHDIVHRRVGDALGNAFAARVKEADPEIGFDAARPGRTAPRLHRRSVALGGMPGLAVIEPERGDIDARQRRVSSDEITQRPRRPPKKQLRLCDSRGSARCQRLPPQILRQPEGHGSRIDSPTPRSTPPSTYMAAERVPTLRSASSVMPGISRNLDGMLTRFGVATLQRAL